MNVMPSRAMPPSILVTPMEGRLRSASFGQWRRRFALPPENHCVGNLVAAQAKVAKRLGDDLDRDFPEGGG